MNPYFNDNFFGDEASGRRADPNVWQAYARRPGRSAQMGGGAGMPTNMPSNFDQNAGVNQRAMAAAGDPYFGMPSGGGENPLDMDNPSGAPPQYFGKAQDPYLGRPLNEGKDPGNHQKLAQTEYFHKQALQEYADGVRQAKGDLNDALRAATERPSAWNRLLGEDTEDRKAMRIANAQAVYTSRLNALNDTMRMTLGNPTEVKHDWQLAPDGTFYDRSAASRPAPGAPKPTEAKYGAPYNDENGLGWVSKTTSAGVERVPYTQKKLGQPSIGPVPEGAPPTKAAVFDEQVSAGSEKSNLAEEKNARIKDQTDKRMSTMLLIASMKAGPAQQGVAQRALATEQRLVGAAQKQKNDALAKFNSNSFKSKDAKPPDTSEWDRTISEGQDQIALLRDAAGLPSGSDKPASTGGGVVAPPPAGDKTGGGQVVLDAAPTGIKAKGYDKKRDISAGKDKNGKWVFWKGR